MNKIITKYILPAGIIIGFIGVLFIMTNVMYRTAQISNNVYEQMVLPYDEYRFIILDDKHVGPGFKRGNNMFLIDSRYELDYYDGMYVTTYLNNEVDEKDNPRMPVVLF